MVLFTVFLIGHNQYVVGRSGGEARRSLLAGQMSIDDGWEKYSELRKSALVPFLLFGLQDTLKSKLLDEGTEPISDYRQDQPTATLADWQQRSRTTYGVFWSSSPETKSPKAANCCVKDRSPASAPRYIVHGRVTLNSKLLNQAIGHFQQAAELMPDSPDPYLAMAPIYLYYEQDYERGMAMQEAAVKRGHTAGKRETAQMADTLRANAKRDLAFAQQLDGDPERKKQHLQSAISAFESAIEYYGQISGFASSSQGLREAILGKQEAQKLLDEMQSN